MYLPSAGGSADHIRMINGPPPPAITQAVLIGLRIAERLDSAQHTLQGAMDASPLDEDALARFSEVALHLTGAQHMATTLATPLAMAEQNMQDVMGVASGFGETTETRRNGSVLSLSFVFKFEKGYFK